MLMIIEYLLGFPIQHPRLTFVAFLLFELLLNIGIILRIPYTEIDWATYMQQVGQFLVGGERNYAKLHGDTGPLVYPAGFLYVFSVLYSATDGGTSLLAAQIFFLTLYIATWVIIYAIYCKAKLPFFYLPLLMLSKRLHSIYVLRLFNDPVCMFFVYLAILCLLYRKFWTGSILLSIGISIKMNALLFLPGWALILLVHKGLFIMMGHLLVIALVQIGLSVPFILSGTSHTYWKCAFDFNRRFLYEWTVNWKFVPTDVFSNPLFGNVLLMTHVGLLCLFLFAFWSKITGGTRLFFIRSCVYPFDPHPNLYSPEDQLVILFASNFIGIICSRSLHYQFYSWYFHSLPFLIYKSNLFLPLQYVLFFTIEICWNIFPSTSTSSLLLLICHITLLLGIFRYHYYALGARHHCH
jgi:alpha-1,3-mannosyltransferase